MKNERYKVHILTPAQREIEEIALLHMELVGPNSARKITNHIYNTLELLRTSPNTGIDCKDKPLRLEGYRMLICGNYLCIYRLIGNTVFVYHIVDGRMNYPKLMDDLK